MDIDGIFKSLADGLDMGQVSAMFFPYSELKHTWRLREGVLRFRVSDYLEGSPEGVLESLAWYLLRRAAGKGPSDGRAELYLGYSRSEGLWARNRDLYLARARSLVLEPKGVSRDLRTVFDYVNSFYFAGRFKGPTLAWAEESPAQRLGFYFEQLNLLAVNRAFDSEQVPRYALEFVVYHELLHSVLAPSKSDWRRVHHTREFREREKEFSHFADAQRWLTRLASRRRPCMEKGVPQA